MNPNRIRWNTDLDEQIRSLRAEGMSWTRIGREMRICRNSVIARGRDLGLHEHTPVSQQTVTHQTPAQSGRTTPLPPGSPETWGVISRGQPWTGPRA